MKTSSQQKAHVLFSWIASRDLFEMLENLKTSNTHRYRILENHFIKKLQRDNEYKGDKTVKRSPIYAALNDKRVPRFDRIYFLWNYGSTDEDKELWDHFRSFVQKGCRYSEEAICIIDTKIAASEAHNLELIYKSARQMLNDAKREHPQIEPHFLIGNGTHQMENIWFLAGDIFFGKNAKFISVDRDDYKVSQFTLLENFTREIEKSLLGDYLPNDAPELEDFKRITENSRCEAINLAVNRANRAAMTDHNILLIGETGTGKELFANAIHARSGRKGNFRAVNCAMSTPQLLESQLFGTIKGAFTGAVDCAGLLEVCNNGTLFLDELEACTPELQAKLLRIMQPPDGKNADTRCFSRVGSSEPIMSHVRIICATNESLQNNGFRSDLFNRAAELMIKLPPLREREDDIELLANAFLEKDQQELTEKGTKSDKHFSPNAINFIKNYSWPGNIRELKNVVLQAILFGNSKQKEITAEDISACLEIDTKTLEEKPTDLSQPIDLKSLADHASNEVKARYILAAYQKCGRQKKKMAKVLGTTYQTLDNWIAGLKKAGMLPPELSVFDVGTENA